MLIVFFVGKSSMGAKRWIQIAGLNLQPGELVKIGSCIMLAKYFAYTILMFKIAYDLCQEQEKPNHILKEPNISQGSGAVENKKI